MLTFIKKMGGMGNIWGKGVLLSKIEEEKQKQEEESQAISIVWMMAMGLG